MKRALSTLRKYLYIFLLIRLVRSQETTLISVESTIGFVLPSFAQPRIGLVYRVICAIWLCLFILFLLQRKSFLIGLQKQAVIMQGLLFGIDLSLNSVGRDYISSITWIIAVVAAPICAILSVNDKFMKTFLCMINSFGLCYVLTLIFRFTSTIKIAVCGLILYFVLMLLISGSEKMQLCFAKIFTVSIAFLTLIQLSGLLNIFWGLHGVTESTSRKVLHFGLTGLIFLLVGVFFVSFTYFSDWLDEKIEQVESITARNSEAPTS